jgi:hypothetical protein
MSPADVARFFVDGGVDFWGLVLLVACTLCALGYAAACWRRRRLQERCGEAVAGITAGGGEGAGWCPEFTH